MSAAGRMAQHRSPNSKSSERSPICDARRHALARRQARTNKRMRQHKSLPFHLLALACACACCYELLAAPKGHFRRQIVCSDKSPEVGSKQRAVIASCVPIRIANCRRVAWSLCVAAAKLRANDERLVWPVVETSAPRPPQFDQMLSRARDGAITRGFSGGPCNLQRPDSRARCKTSGQSEMST